jgi:ADP-dependent NAD(P)H-hydrate dehydratase / NAD(P)H-hydrate epimerase
MTTALYAPAAVRKMDQRAFARGVAPHALMERAAGHLARGVLAVGGRGYGLRVAVLAGKGNNGGGGLAAARRLVREAGAAPTVCLVGGEDALSDDAVEQLQRWRSMGGRLVGTAGQALEGADVAVDCLLGTGATGEPRQPFAAAIETLNAWRGPVVACDVPTGVDADTGEVPGVAVRADMTVTLGAHKRGLHVWPARGRCGRIVLGDLGIVDRDDRPDAVVLDHAAVAGMVPPSPPEGDKRDRGVVVVLAGSPGMGGAAVLVARGALATGAGLVTVATSGAVRPQVATSVPEALTAGLPDDDPDAAFDILAGHLERADAVAVGPGLGLADATVALVRRVVAEATVPVVVDADAVNAFRHDGDRLRRRAAPLLVATPHERELNRLAGEDLWADRLAVVPDRAAAWNTVVVAKGPGSLTAAPDGRVWVNPTGGAALATGGTGDVLTGMTAALVAQRPDPETVAAAVYLHGLAGDAAGRRHTDRAVTAGRVAAAIPVALHRLAGLR